MVCSFIIKFRLLAFYMLNCPGYLVRKNSKNSKCHQKFRSYVLGEGCNNIDGKLPASILQYEQQTISISIIRNIF
jgi:hypothetical protein